MRSTSKKPVKPNDCNDMEHYDKYYLVKASDFNNRRARLPPTSYGEQKRHDIQHSYIALLRELTGPSARVFDAAAEFRKKAQSAINEEGQEGKTQVLLINPFDLHPNQRSGLVQGVK